MPETKLIHTLSRAPVLGVDMSWVTLLRLDLAGGLAPGNKSYKLEANLHEARAGGIRRLLSFGGAWSNHLHALAAVGREQGFETVGIVRGERSATPSAMLCDVAAWGMQLEHVSREDYRRRHNPAYLAALQERYGPCLIIPEGGANAAGVQGCQNIARLIPGHFLDKGHIVLAVGTGTTLAGLAAGLTAGSHIVGISVLKGARDIDRHVSEAIAASAITERAQWEILHDHHCGGYARVSADLKAFIIEFERVQQVPLDPVYTAKMLYAVHQMLAGGEWSGETLCIHTGGLQGRRGFSWLS